jgi:hypothetical protein
MVRNETRLRVRAPLIKAVVALIPLLFSATVGRAQTGNLPAADVEYTRELVALISALQKNPWRGWAAGTEVTVRYIVDRDAAGKALGKEQPDVVFKVTEADKLFEITQVVKSKPLITEFFVKDEEGLAVAAPRITEPTPAELEIDGFKLACFLTTVEVREIPGSSSRVTKEWSLASDASLVLRKEVNGEGWRVTSARVKKTVAGKAFSCIEIKKSMRFFSDGPSESLTTQYRCPGVPGHVVEETQEFFRLKKGQRSLTPFQVVHQNVVEIRLPVSS